MAITLAEAVVIIKASGLDVVNRQLNTSTDRVKRFSNQLDRAGNRMNRTFTKGSTQAGGLKRGLDGLTSSATALGGRGGAAIGRFSGILRLGTGSAIAFGASLAAAGAIAVGVLGVQSVRAAGRLEAQLANVATISKQVENNFGDIQKQVISLVSATNVRSDLLSAGLYQTISAGITDTTDALSFLKTAALSARAGLTTVGTSVQGLAAAVNAFGFQATEVTAISDKFFTTVQQGVLTFGDLANNIGTVAPLAAATGVSLDEVLASGAALTLTGQSLSEAFTGIRQTIQAIIKPTGEAAKEADRLGIQFNAVALESKGLAGFLTDLSEVEGLNIETLGKMFGSIEALNAVLALTGNQSESFTRILNDVKTRVGATSDAIAIQNRTLESNISLVKNEWSVLMTNMGRTILPAATSAAKGLAGAIRGINRAIFDLSNAPPIRVEIETPEEFRGRIGSRTIRPEPREDTLPGGEGASFFEFLQRSGGLQRRAQRLGGGPITNIGVPTAFETAVGGGFAPGAIGAQPLRPGAMRPTGPLIESRFQAQELNLLETSIELTNTQVERSIDLFEDFQTSTTGAFASAEAQLQQFIATLVEQGIVVNDQGPILLKHTDAWRRVNRIVVPLQQEITANQQAQTNALEKFQSLSRQLPTLDLSGIFGIVPQALDADTLEGLNEQITNFQQFQDQLTQEEAQGAAQRERLLGNELKARLIIFNAEVAARKKATARNIANGELAAIAIEQIEANASEVRINIIAEEEKRKREERARTKADERRASASFNAQIARDEVRAQAQILTAAGDTLDAKLLLFDFELTAKKAQIRERVKDEEEAQRRITELERVSAVQRRAIFARTFRAIPLPEVLRGGALTPTGEAGPPRGFVAPSTSFLDRFVDELLIAGEDTASSFRAIRAAIEGGKAGGLSGAIAAFVVALAQETEGFARIMDSTEKLLGGLTEALAPLLDVIADAVTPLFEGLSSALEGLIPLFQLLGNVLKVITLPLKGLGAIVEGLGSVIKDVGGGIKSIFQPEEFAAGQPKFAQVRAQEELARRGTEFQRLKNLDRLPAEIAKLPAAFQKAAFIRSLGPIDVKLFEEQKPRTLTEESLALSESREEEAAKQKASEERRTGGGAGKATGGITISQITGPSRDILVSALSPLKQLNTTFPQMLDELRLIRSLLGGGLPSTTGMAAADMAIQLPVRLRTNRNVEQPGLQELGATNLQPMTVGAGELSGTFGSVAGNGDMITINGGINVSVEQVSDLTIDEIDRQLQGNLRTQRRQVGNRGRVARIT